MVGRFDNDAKRLAYLQNLVSLANYYIFERQLNLVIRLKDVFYAPTDASKKPLWDVRSRDECTYVLGSARCSSCHRGVLRPSSLCAQWQASVTVREPARRRTDVR